MQHVHHDLIVAWAKGAKIEYRDATKDCWITTSDNRPSWLPDREYRIKPEPKPDSVKIRTLTYNAATDCVLIQGTRDAQKANIMFIFDGETGALKDAQVLAKLV